MPRDLYHFPDVIIPFRFIVAPLRRQAELFIKDSGFHPRECKIATRLEHLRGYDFRGGGARPPGNGWEVWWLDGCWPCSTHEDVRHMEQMWAYLRHVLGADVRRWHT